MKKMNFVITYDISNEKRLRKTALFLEKNAIRIEYSAFFVEAERKKIMFIIKEIKKIINKKEDDVRVYRVNLSKSIILKNAIDVKKLLV